MPGRQKRLWRNQGARRRPDALQHPVWFGITLNVAAGQAGSAHSYSRIQGHPTTCRSAQPEIPVPIGNPKKSENPFCDNIYLLPEAKIQTANLTVSLDVPRELLALHYRYRFEPLGLNTDEKSQMTRLSSAWLAENHPKQIAPQNGWNP